MLKLATIALVVIGGVLPSPAGTQSAGEILVLTNVNIVDGVSSQPIRRGTIIIRDGKVVSVEASPSTPPPTATVLDLKGMWVLPGLIDAHVHLQNLTAARVALASGITTLRSGGSNLDVGIRELNHEGVVTLPDVVAAGYPVMTSPPELFFVDFPKLNDLMNGVKGEANVRRIVRANVGRGVNVIKVLATERSGLPRSDPRRRTFNDAELGAIVDEARNAGLPVMAHAHGDEGAVAAVRAGVRSIEHGTYVSDETLALMKARGTFFVPTLTVGLRGLANPNSSPEVSARSRAERPRMLEVTSRAIKMGVKVVAGTDVRYDDQFRLQDELVEFVHLGMSPLDAIRAGTSLAAQCLMINTRTGSIRPGLEADLIVVERDPTVDIETLRDVLMVVNNGKVVVNRLKP